MFSYLHFLCRINDRGDTKLLTLLKLFHAHIIIEIYSEKDPRLYSKAFRLPKGEKKTYPFAPILQKLILFLFLNLLKNEVIFVFFYNSLYKI
jgi:hypothetical protein